MTQELAEVKNTNIVMMPSGQPDLLATALQNGADVTVLEKIMDLVERNNEAEAKRQFVDAMNKFRSTCPPVKKTKKGHNTKYAGLAESIDQIKGAMAENGLSHRWTTGKDTDGLVLVTCIVSHVAGHEESTTLTGEPDTSGSKNSIQAIGSTVSYLQRYTLFAALGIASEDDDTDGNAVNLAALQEAIKTHWKSIAAIKQGIEDEDFNIAAEAWFELTDKEKASLWVAPTKGGIFTTKERDVMKSAEFRKAFYGEDK